MVKNAIKNNKIDIFLLDVIDENHNAVNIKTAIVIGEVL